MDKVVLAYSGGLDTSVAIKWINERYHLDVIAVTVDTGAGPQQVQNQQVVLTDWSSDPAGKLQFGYRWASGSEVSLTYWAFDNDQRTVGDGEVVVQEQRE